MQINGKKLNTTWIVIAIVAVFVFFYAFGSYNSMVNLDEECQQSWANVQNVYQRRADLIPNLVNTVKGYAAHEQKTLQGVTEARAGLTEAYNAARETTTDGTGESFERYQQVQERLNSALGIYINAVHEAYPDLNASENFLNLQAQLEGTENRISTERHRYNETVRAYNVKVRRFPASLFASIFGFQARQPFEAEAAAQQAPKVEF